VTKNNDKFRWFARTAIFLIVIAVGAAVAWGVLKERVNNNRDRIEVVEKKAQENKETVIRMEEGIEYIKKAVDRIETKIDDRR